MHPEVDKMGPITFNIFINYMGNGTECTLSKFEDDTKLGGVLDRPGGSVADQRDLIRLWEMDKEQSHEVQQRETKNPVPEEKHNHAAVQPRGQPPGEQLCRRRLKVLADSSLAMSKQYLLAAKKPGSLLGCIRKSIASRSGKRILLYSAPV